MHIFAQLNELTRMRNHYLRTAILTIVILLSVVYFGYRWLIQPVDGFMLIVTSIIYFVSIAILFGATTDLIGRIRQYNEGIRQLMRG